VHSVCVALINCNSFNLPAEVIATLREGIENLSRLFNASKMSADTIKNFCATLQAANVVRVIGCYDGSGDSGDIHYRFYIETPRRNPGNHPPSTQSKSCSAHEMQCVMTSGPAAVTTPDMFDEFTNAVFDLLPGGWEIDDGSYGDITVDVLTKEITVEHNERYTEVRSRTERY
jgi:hypothetical protein